jgi:uncharacterized coiled-coil DUF342 family protein
LDGNLARALDRADEEIDRFIEKRHAEREALNAQAEAERASERDYLSRTRDYRSEWIEHHRRQAAILQQLAEQHRQEIGKLIDGCAD